MTHFEKLSFYRSQLTLRKQASKNVVDTAFKRIRSPLNCEPGRLLIIKKNNSLRLFYLLQIYFFLFGCSWYFLRIYFRFLGDRRRTLQNEQIQEYKEVYKIGREVLAKNQVDGVVKMRKEKFLKGLYSTSLKQIEDIERRHFRP